ncbi:hypothetical protein O9G_000505 [Rozella allomycis CSF55]|uniref:L domain-like protein n=1 Tax=Rozella allomycis (strain CSF55) TaxID=988480 RepID=A0A075AVM7_ROZAC|nr:hypothetical protein O9G_000505 [Rozella allomycis CSF55]|eukprot:EPZ34318.1 hypothetical protein O9G_000505 [Rozella allomycis CSF55]
MPSVSSIVSSANSSGERTINLQNKGLKEFPVEVINVQIPHVKRLILSNNKIDCKIKVNITQAVPDSAGLLKLIEELYLFNNRIENVSQFISQMNSLKFLNFNMNRITDLPKGFGNFANLIILDLSCNKLSTLRPNFFLLSNDLSFQFPASLKALHLSDNEFESIPNEISKLKNLVTLNMRDNKISYIPKEIGDCESLRELFLQGNKIRTLPASLSKLPLDRPGGMLRLAGNSLLGGLVESLKISVSNLWDFMKSEEYEAYLAENQ